MDMDDDFIGSTEFDLSADQGEVVRSRYQHRVELDGRRIRASQPVDCNHAVVGNARAGERA